MLAGDQVLPSTPYCLWCYSVDDLNRCGRCGIAHYCSKDHQVQHWKIHRKECKQKPSFVNVSQTRAPTTNSECLHVADDQTNYSNWFDMTNTAAQTAIDNAPTEVPLAFVQASTSSSFRNAPATLQPVGQLSTGTLLERDMFIPVQTKDLTNLRDYTEQSNVDMFSSLHSELFSSSNDYWDLINSCSDFNFDCDFSIPQNDKVVQETLNDLDMISPSVVLKDSISDETDDVGTQCCGTIEDICANVIYDLNEFGICVIDNFLGSKIGDIIATEVKLMFLKGIFKRGELVSSGPWRANQNVRGDVITWVNGTEPNCTYIGNLIKKLDIIMASCNKMPENGILSKYKLNRRTKAMIACYPGDGTHYKKHIDNPHGDGRCITCIYYLNKNWDTKKHGGVLRMFPVGHEDNVANIEPLFDRMLFFWSDKRNPHEVLPSFDVRFAITVWYFDSEERDKALSRCRSSN